MSIYSSRRKSRRAPKSHLGHLKLSVIEESSALVVHVFEARGLQRRDNGSLDTYVKLYLLPDPQKSTKEKTKVVKQKDPVFNQKFSFILGECDRDKQLFISVWTKQLASRNEMLGCMTFNVADLLGPNKGLNGWYQVLDEMRGRSESLMVPTSISKQDASLSKYESSALRGQKIFTVMVMKGPKGYGFSVHTTSPVYITQVSQGLPAANADLRVGDIILEVQGNDVRNASGDQVVEMIQNSPNTVYMILQRDLANPQHLLGRSVSSRFPKNSLSQGVRSRSFLSIPPGVGEQVEDIPTEQLLAARPEKRQRHSVHSTYYSSQHLMPEYHDNPYLATLNISPVKQPPQTTPYGTLPRRGRAEGMEMGVLSQPAAMYDMGGGAYAMGGGRHNTLRVPGQQVGGDYDPSHLYPGMGPTSYGPGAVYGGSSRKKLKQKTRSVSSEGGDQQAGFERLAGALSQPDFKPDFNPTGALSQPNVVPEPANVWGRGGGSMRQPPPSRHAAGRMYGTMVERRSSLTQYDQIEEVGGPFAQAVGMAPMGSNYVAEHHYPHGNRPHPPSMVHLEDTDGAERRGVATGGVEQEEELPVEWESLTILEQKRQKAIHNLVAAEQALCQELETGMETYVQPLRPILSSDSHRKIFLGIPELAAFSQDFCAQLQARRKPYVSAVSHSSHYLHSVADIYMAKLQDFVRTLKTYCQNSQAARQEIALTFTNEEFTKLVQTSVEDDSKTTIYSVVEAGKEYVQKLIRWTMALFYLTPLLHQDQKHLYLIVEALLPLCSEKELVQKWEEDRDVMKNKQLCVSFGAKVPSFRLLVPGRMLLHEGEVSIKRKKLWLMLFSDMVLLTKKNGRIFTCVESPIMLDSLTIPDINCSEATDFQLVVVDGTLSRLIRAPSVSAKEEWVRKLKERASGSLANKKRSGDKRNHRLQEALRKQSHLLASTLAVDSEIEVTAHNPMTPIPEIGRATKKKSHASSPDDKTAKVTGSGNDSAPKAADEGQLKRGASRRRSLFSLGKSKEPGSSGGKKKSPKSTGSGSSPQSPTIAAALSEIPVKVLKEWESCFNSLLKDKEGQELFELFLKTEFSEENLQFWLACEKFKATPDHLVEKEANLLYVEYIAPQAPKLVNIDHQTTKEIVESMKNPSRSTFNKAQQSIYLLMARDSFVRFIKSENFQSALQR